MRHRAPSDATMAAVNCNAAAACTRAAAPPRQASASSPASFGQPSRQLRAAHSASLSGQAVGAHRVGCYRSHRLRAAPAPRAMARFETERTYVMIKPDGVQRGLVGNVISRFEAKGFVLKGLKLFQCPQALAEEHYKDLSAKPFFKDLVTYICSGPVVAMVWEGPRVVSSARKIIGATNPAEAEPGTIRGDLAVEVGRNVVHGSDSAENGEREIKLWFQGAGVVDWSPTVLPWLREM